MFLCALSSRPQLGVIHYNKYYNTNNIDKHGCIV